MALPMALLSILGGLGSGLGLGTQKGRNLLFGQEGRYEQVPTMLPEQQQLLQQLLGGLSGEGGAQQGGLNYLQQLLSGDEGAFADFEAPYKRQFEQEIAPGIAERFAGMGTGGSLSSSGFQQSLAQGGRELSENLASLRGNLKQNALSQLQGLLGQSFRPSFESVYQQPKAGFFGGLLQGAGSGLGQAGGLQALRGLGIG